jgi:hypothetical protein
MAATLTFGQIEAILATMEGVHEDRRGAFHSRLKQWQKMGFPQGVNVGRGVRAPYGANQLFQLVYMVELLRVGLTPDRAIETVIAAWDTIRMGITETVQCHAGESDHLHYISLKIDSLTNLTEPGADHMHIYAQLLIDKHLGMAAFLGYGDTLPEAERASYREFRLHTLNKLAGAIILETDSLIMRVWAAMEILGIEPSVLKDDFSEWRVALTENAAAPSQPLLVREPPEKSLPVAETDDEPALDAGGHARALLGYASAEEVWAEHEANHARDPFVPAETADASV